jgi:hypothetical protein
MALYQRETWSSSPAMEQRGSRRRRRGEEGRVEADKHAEQNVIGESAKSVRVGVVLRGLGGELDAGAATRAWRLHWMKVRGSRRY